MPLPINLSKAWEDMVKAPVAVLCDLCVLGMLRAPPGEEAAGTELNEHWQE